MSWCGRVCSLHSVEFATGYLDGPWPLHKLVAFPTWVSLYCFSCVPYMHRHLHGSSLIIVVGQSYNSVSKLQRLLRLSCMCMPILTDLLCPVDLAKSPQQLKRRRNTYGCKSLRGHIYLVPLQMKTKREDVTVIQLKQ